MLKTYAAISKMLIGPEDSEIIQESQLPADVDVNNFTPESEKNYSVARDDAIVSKRDTKFNARKRYIVSNNF